MADEPIRKGCVDVMGSGNDVFFGFLRAGEVVVPSDSAFDPSIHLTVKDISVDSHSSPSYIAVNIKASKTDPFRRGVTIYLGRTHNQICPVAATLRYMVERGLAEGPLFVFENGRLLTRERFVAAVRESLASAGVDTAKYSGHSFRIGAATTAAERGITPGLSHQDDGKMGELGLPSLYTYPKRRNLLSGEDTARKPPCDQLATQLLKYGASVTAVN